METQLDLLAWTPRNIICHGASFDLLLDVERLGGQQRRVHALMLDGEWRTLRQIADATNDPEASISARLRNYRSSDYLAKHFIMESQRKPGCEKRGVWQYRLMRRV